MSQENGFKLLSKTSFLKNNEESEPFTIFEKFSTNSSAYNKPAYKLDDGEKLPWDLKESFDFDNLAYKPLEEIDPEYCRKQTFLTIGADSTVHRFSGRRSPFILNPLKPLRRVGIYLLSHWHLPVLIGISLCLLCLSLVLPNYPYISTSFLRYLFSFVLLAEIFVNVLARGVLVDEFTYLRNPWHWLDVVIWAIIFLDNLLENSFLHSFQGVALLKFIPLVPALKRNGFRTTIKTLKNLLPALIYSLIIVWILIVLGLHLQRYESSTTKCHKNDNIVVNTEDINLKNRTSISISNNTINNTVNSLFDCVNDTEIVASLYAVILRSLELTTLGLFGGFPHEINLLNQSFKYILLTLVFGTLGIGVLTTASILDSFLDQPSKRYRNKTRNLNICQRLLPRIQTSNCDCSALNTINEILYHPFFEIFITTIISLDIMLALLTVSLKESLESQKSVILHGQQACLVIYLIEFALKLLTGPFRYIRNRWALLDIFVVGIYVLDKSVSYRLTWVLLIRVFKITPRWPKLYSMINILFSSLVYRFQMIFVLCIFIFAYLMGSRSVIKGTEEPSLSPFVFLFNNWYSRFQTCNSISGPYLCIFILLLEILIAVVFVTVIFTAVIYITYESLRTPTELPVNFRNLVKGVSIITSVFCQKCCCSRSPEFTETRPPREGISSNGGPKFSNDVDLGCNSESITVGGENIKKLWNASYHDIMQWISIVVILTATVASIVDLGESTFNKPRIWMDVAFIIFFVTILIWKSVTEGWKMLKSPCWVFDFLIVSASGITLYLTLQSNSDLYGLPLMKTITALSCCKGLMLISRIKFTRAAAFGIVNELHAIWGYLIASLFLFLYFLNLKLELPVEILSYFSGSSLKDTSYKPFLGIGKISLPFLMLVGGILVGVVFYQLMRKNLLNFFMTKHQQKVYKDNNSRRSQEKMLIIPYPKRKVCMQIIHYVTLTDAFDGMVLGFILCDCLVITLSPFAMSKDWKIIWSFYPFFIVSLYFFEFIVKICGWRKYFFKSRWNIFDLAVLVVNIVDVLLIKVQFGLVTASLIRFLRILRLFQLKPLLKKTKLIQILYAALIRISPIMWNLLLLYLIFLYSYAAIGVVNLKSSPQELIEAFHLFKNIIVSLLMMPFYPDIYKNSLRVFKETNNIAQTPSCWKEYEDSLWMLYLNSYLVISYLIIANFFAISVYEILIGVDKDFNYSTCSNGSKDNESCYKHTNGMLLAVRSPDDMISMETMLTPIDNTNLGDNEIEPFKTDDENRYPMQISANGYIIHVEANVSTV